MADNFNVKLSELSALNKSIIEANAAAQGISPQQYLSSRGGVNPVTGMFGDSFNPAVNLTDAEYKAALAGKVGAAQGEAINKAQQEKYQKSLAASGTAYRAPDGTYYASESEARQSGALSGTGSSMGGAMPTVAQTEAQQKRQNAFDILYSQFSEYGLQGLVEPLKNLILEDVSPAEFAIRLRQTEPYKKRFAANAARIGKGLRALSEGEYLALEDGYQSIMRNYGLPATYYAKGDLGRQEGFEKLIAGDVSAPELEDRIAIAQNRVLNAPPQVKEALQRFYPDINNSDILAYTLDPEKGLMDIRRKVTAAEIGGAALGAGLATDVTRAEELAKFGVTAERAREGYQAAVPLIERGSQLAGFYQESPYTQRTAEEELFGLTYAPEATAKRKRLTSLEQAQFAGQSGMTGGALSRERAGSF
jgi:hypothetical protein